MTDEEGYTYAAIDLPKSGRECLVVVRRLNGRIGRGEGIYFESIKQWVGEPSGTVIKWKYKQQGEE